MTTLIYPLNAGTNPIVEDAYSKWSGTALQAFSRAQAYAGQMGDITFTPVTFDASFDPQIALGGFPVMAPPPTPTADLKFNPPTSVPEPPSPDTIAYTPTAVPTGVPTAPTYLPPAAPTLQPLSTPGDAPAIAAVTVPAPPDYQLPAVPSLEKLVVPALPAITLPVFDSAKPVFNAPIPAETFSFTPQAYTDALLDKTKSVLTSMMNGDFVLPLAAVNAIRARAQTAANVEEARGVDQAYREIGARGFNEPNGLLNERVKLARDTALKSRSESNRDVYIQDQTVAVENLRTAIQGGIQLEGQLIQLHLSETQLQFDAAKFALETALQILQARVSVYNAQLQGYVADAAVYRDKIAGAQATVELYRAQLDGLRIKGELNMQQVTLYNAQLQGVRTLMETYTAQISAAEVTARANLATVQAYTAKVQAFGAEVSAQNAQWMGYKTQVDAQLGAAQFYQTSVNAYGERVRAWAVGESNTQNANRLKLEQGKMSLDTWRAKLESFESRLKAELARIQTVAQTFGSQVDVFKANADVANAAGQYNERRFQLNLAQEQAIVDTSLKRSEASFEQMKYLTSALIEIKRTLTTVQSQLAASAMNAVNIGASLNASTSNSVGWNTGVNFSGSIDDMP